jgi:hypothetical protein
LGIVAVGVAEDDGQGSCGVVAELFEVDEAATAAVQEQLAADSALGDVVQFYRG